MEPLQKEIAELKGFVTDLKNDRTAQKEKEQRDSWTKYVSMTLICLAVLAAIATLKGGGFTTRTLKEMNEATLQQAQASDQWAFFQAKSIKQNLYEIELDHLKNTGTATTNALDKAKAKVDKYDKEKSEIKAKAEELEAKRDGARAFAKSAAEHSRSEEHTV